MAREQEADNGKIYNQVIARAWSDPVFKRRFIEDPKSVAKEYGINIPTGVELRVVENSPTVVHVVLPAQPSDTLLSDEQLEAVAGGVAGADSVVGGTPKLPAPDLGSIIMCRYSG